MVTIHNYYKEKPGVKHGDVYLKAGLFGAFLAFVLLGGIKLLIYLIKLLIEYWVWAIGVIGCVFLARHFLIRKKVRV